MPPQVQVETLKTLKKAIDANRSLAELRSAGELIPNQSLLVRAIVLQEAKLSSEIENVITTNDELYRAFGEDPERADPATKEVLRYQEAVWNGVNHLKAGGQLDSEFFVATVRIIKQAKLGVRTNRGTTRIVDQRTNTPVYTPPEGRALLQDLLDNLRDYIHAENGVDALIKLAVIHYQFEAIHPFSDGNGRAGRVLNILYLLHAKLLTVPVLYLSRYIIRNETAYYRGLRGVTEEARWEDWILYMLEAIEATAIDTKRRILSIRDALAMANDTARNSMRRGYRNELVELVFQQPYTRISDLERARIAKRDAASEYLRELERVGLLASRKIGRERLFFNQKLLDILAD